MAPTSGYMGGAPLDLIEVIPIETLLGESPLWDERTGLLYWIDIPGEEIGALSVTSRKWVTLPTRRRFGSIALTSTPGHLLAATASGLEVVKLTNDGVLEVSSIAAPEVDQPGNRFNDGKTDRQGRFWAGTMEDAETGQRTGSMYRLDPDGSLTRAWGDVGIPNGLCFSPDGETMYTADSMDGTIWAAPYDTTSGEPGPRVAVAKTAEPGGPDGSTVDEFGGIWNAEWGSSRLVRYLPDGTIDRVLDMPASKPTCMAFGGMNLDMMFVTTAQVGGDAGEHGGSLLVYDVGIKGISETAYQLT